MARRTVVICDRCGHEGLDDDDGHLPCVTPRRAFDLCGECHSALEAFVAGSVVTTGRVVQAGGLLASVGAVPAVAPVVSIDRARDERFVSRDVVAEDDAKRAELLAAARANPGLFPGIPDYLKR